MLDACSARFVEVARMLAWLIDHADADRERAIELRKPLEMLDARYPANDSAKSGAKAAGTAKKPSAPSAAPQGASPAPVTPAAPEPTPAPITPAPTPAPITPGTETPE